MTQPPTPAPALPGIAGVQPDALDAWFAARGEPAYRTRQLLEAAWSGATGFDDVATLPRALRAELVGSFRFDTLGDTELRLSDDGLTEKGLHVLGDGATVESVLMRYPARRDRRERNTLCISSQAGCAVGCPFCATGELGFERDLSAAEILDQVRHAARRLAGADRRLTVTNFFIAE
jgi:23S rRNA (adenine2503-C2)-methyltransferase